MKIQHFITTRFCIKLPLREKNGAIWFRKQKESLKYISYRLKLLEIFCAPSLKGQTNKQFTWVILVEKDLYPEIRSRLESICKSMPFRAILHNYDSAVPLESTEWLEPYFEHAASPSYVITTNIDDDDSLAQGFVESLQETANQAIIPKDIPFAYYGLKRPHQWDFQFTKQAPLGTHSPWHRHDFFSNLGNSTICRYPDFPFTQFGIVHVKVRSYFTTDDGVLNEGSRAVKQLLFSYARNTGKELNSYDQRLVIHEYKNELTGLICNHFENDQIARLTEDKGSSKPVFGQKTFPSINIDWDKLQEYRKDFEVSQLQLRMNQMKFRFSSIARRAARKARHQFRSFGP